MSEQIKAGNRTIEISNSQKIIFPGSKISKGDLISYYHRIAPLMLPHLKNRPLTLRRFPDGIKKKGFYQKDASDYFPAWIKTIRVRKKSDGSTNYVLCNTVATLVYLANQLTLTFHRWLSCAPNITKPDQIVFDLDPSGKASFALVRWTALELKKLLKQVGLVPFVMTTGSRGLHVVAPIKKYYDFDTVRDFARECAQLLIDKYPKKLTLEMRKAKRGNRIFIDVLRNAFAQTAVAPYSVRALKGAPIATPITWQELSRAGMNSQKYTLKNIFQRVARVGDPWKKIRASARSVGNAWKVLARLFE